MRRLIVWVTVGLLLSGCGVDRNSAILMAAGSYGDLAVVVSDPELAPIAERFLAGFVQTRTFVIKEEPDFNADVYEPDKWELAKGYKNILFITRLGDGGPVEKAVRSKVSAEAQKRFDSGSGGIVQVNDPWSTYQLAVVVASPDRNSLGSILHNNTDRLREIFNLSARDRILRHNRYTGLQTDLMNDYWQRFGFMLEIPVEFKQNQLLPDGFQGVELMRQAPSRGITVTWQAAKDPAALLGDLDALAAMRAEMGEKMHDEEILPESFVWRETELAGRPVAKLEGAWNSHRFDGGGPFWCYFIPDPEHGRIFCLDLLAYAPGLDKMDYFRQLEAIATTFSLTQPRP